MMRWLSTLCLLGVAGGLLAADEKKADVKAQATALMVRKPLPPKKTDPLAFVDTGSTALDVTLTATGKYVLGVDLKASKLEHFTDDKQTKLDSGNRFGQNWLSDYPQITPDGEQCTVHLSAPTPPAKGAAKVQVKATVVLQCGADEKATDKKEIAIKKDQKETVGAFTIQVVNDGAAFGGPQIAVISDKQIVKGAEFFDAKGEAIKLQLFPYRQNVFAGPGKMQYSLVSTLPQKADKVSVKVNYFNKVEPVEVPLDLSVGVGLE
jgi:hypothetical protein